MKWRPIETAPKNGTAIMSWDGQQCAVIVYCCCHKEWRLLDGDLSEWTGSTHWMPLPVPPSSDQDQQATKSSAGVKGGKARAAALSSERRKEIAKAASNARWGNRAETS